MVGKFTYRTRKLEEHRRKSYIGELETKYTIGTGEEWLGSRWEFSAVWHSLTGLRNRAVRKRTKMLLKEEFPNEP
jgi:hypothetical protein